MLNTSSLILSESHNQPPDTSQRDRDGKVCLLIFCYMLAILLCGFCWSTINFINSNTYLVWRRVFHPSATDNPSSCRHFLKHNLFTNSFIHPFPGQILNIFNSLDTIKSVRTHMSGVSMLNISATSFKF